MRRPLRTIWEPHLLFLCRGNTSSLHRAICSGGGDALSGPVVLLVVVACMSLLDLLRVLGFTDQRNIVIIFQGRPDRRYLVRHK